MRIVTITALSLIMFASARAEAADIPSPAGFSKVELVQEPDIGGARKLLGWSGGNVYLAKKDGSISVVDKDWKELMVLQAKDGKGEVILKRPEAVAVADGVIYVVDSKTERVAMFTAQGQYQGSFGKGDGLSSPNDIAIHEGIVYVADSGNGRIQLFGINGVFIATLEINGSPENIAAKEKELPYQLGKPTDIEIDATGSIYVLDANDDLVKIYSPKGGYQRHLPADGKPLSLAIARDGIYVVDREFTIHKYDIYGKQVSSFGSMGKGRAQFKSITGLATDQDRQVFVGDSEKGIANIFMVEAGAPLDPSVKRPSRISVRWEGAIPVSVGKITGGGKDTMYGVDADNRKIVKIVNGAIAGEIKVKDFSPVSAVIDKNGILWALDKKEARLVKLDEAGNILDSIGTVGSRKGEFYDAVDFAISSTGTMFVADSGNHRVQAFNSGGIFLQEIRSDVSGKLETPIAIAIDFQDRLYVLDKGRSVVSIYSAKGEPLGVFGQKEGSVTLTKPVSLMVTQDEVFVLDSNQVKVFSHKGDYIRSFATKGSSPGELDEPLSITATGDTTFGISDHGNKRLQTFTTLHKPTAPEQLAAQGAARSIELSWAASKTPYVKHYQIYRSQNEKSGFVQIATSKTNQYSDQNMEAEKKYFYRVVAISQQGYTGARSEVVNGSAQQSVPPVLAPVGK